MSDRPPHRSPEFIKFWVGQSMSLVGSEVSQLSMPLLAVLSLGASPGEMGMLRAVNDLADGHDLRRRERARLAAGVPP